MEDLELKRLQEAFENAKNISDFSEKELNKYIKKKEKERLGYVGDRPGIINRQREKLIKAVIDITKFIIGERVGIEFSCSSSSELMEDFLDLKDYPWLKIDRELYKSLVIYWWDLHEISQEILDKDLINTRELSSKIRLKINEKLFKKKKDINLQKIAKKNKVRSDAQRRNPDFGKVKKRCMYCRQEIENECKYCIFDT